MKQQPEIEVPRNLAAELDGFIMGEAFLKFVIKHPSVQAHRERLPPEWAAFFSEGRVPGTTLYPYRWSCSISADSLALQSLRKETPNRKIVGKVLWTREIADRDFASSGVSATVRLACADIANQVNLLFGYLRRGEVIAIDMDGHEVGRAAWSRPSSRIDVQSSDLFDGDQEVPLRRGLTLRFNGPGSLGLPRATSRDAAQSKRAGRRPAYDYDRLKEKLVEHCRHNGQFDSRTSLVAWCRKNTPLLPGRHRPKGANNHPNGKTMREAIKKYQLDRIGLAEEVMLQGK